MTSAADAIQPITASPSKGLLARAIGVVFSPRATYAEIAARPRALGAIVAVMVVMAATNFAFLSTKVGQLAMLDQQMATMETLASMGIRVTDEMRAGIEASAPRAKYFAAGGIIVSVPLVVGVIAGLAFLLFTAIMGGDASFKQVFAITAHAAFINALQLLFITPLNYVRESLSSTTSLGVFLPMLDDGSFLGMLAGSVDFFRIWSLVSLAIGLGVLYKKRTAPIAWSLVAVYGVVMLVVAGVRATLFGA